MLPTTARENHAQPLAQACRPPLSPRSTTRSKNHTRLSVAAPASASASEQPPPYTQLSLPVYSLATVDPQGGNPTMNLVTYAAPISLQPRHYALGLYRNTLSWQNMLATRKGVLQILGEQHAALFELLGRTSGRYVDKLAALAARGVAVTRRPADGIPLLDDSLGWMELQMMTEPATCGDHDVAICAVTHWHTPKAAAGRDQGLVQQPLYTGRLRELGLM